MCYDRHQTAKTEGLLSLKVGSHDPVDVMLECLSFSGMLVVSFVLIQRYVCIISCAGIPIVVYIGHINVNIIQ